MLVASLPLPLVGVGAVGRESIPDYFVVIKKPMDLGTIKNALGNGGYNANPQGVLADIKLTFENCKTYTGDPSSPWWAHAASAPLASPLPPMCSAPRPAVPLGTAQPAKPASEPASEPASQ